MYRVVEYDIGPFFYKKPEPAKEFIEFLKSMDIKNPYEMSFFHVYELDENGSILQELDPKDF